MTRFAAHRLTELVPVLTGVALALLLSRGATAAEPEKLTAPVLFNTPAADRIVAAMQIFPADNPWNADISNWPRHKNSDALVASIGADKPLRYNPDMAYVLVPPDQKKIDLKLVEYPDESDKGPFPIPDNVPIEGWPANFTRDMKDKRPTLDDVQRDVLNQGGDRHAIVVDPAAGKLYEFYQLKKVADGWQAAQSSIFDLKSNKLRPDGWTSSDAAGLPIFPAIIRYDELERGMVNHAMRFTVRNSRRAYVYPATHYASRKTDSNLPRMGERFRLKADYDISGFSKPVQAILKGLKKHGMFVADNGLEWALSCAPDERIPVLHEELRRIKGSAFESLTGGQAPVVKYSRDLMMAILWGRMPYLSEVVNIEVVPLEKAPEAYRAFDDGSPKHGRRSRGQDGSHQTGHLQPRLRQGVDQSNCVASAVKTWRVSWRSKWGSGSPKAARRSNCARGSSNTTRTVASSYCNPRRSRRRAETPRS